MKRKIIFFTDSLAGGGASRVISNIANRIIKTRPVEIVCLHHFSQRYKTDEKINVVYLDEISSSWMGRISAFRKRVNSNDIVIAFMVKYYCLAIFTLLGKRITIIASERNDPKRCATIWKLIRKFLLPNVSGFVVQTQSIKNYFPKIIKDKTHIIVNPISVGQYSSQPWNEMSKTVIAVGNLTPQKNYTMMINAFHMFHQRHPDFLLDIYGNKIAGNIDNKGGYDELKEQVSRLNADSYIRFMGNADDVSAVYTKAYMFVMSSDFEGMSNSLIEAMCSGIPIVSTNVSGAIDLIENNNNGLLVPVGDVDGFCAAMCKIAEDKVFAKKLSANVVKSRPQFTEDSIYARWESLIEDVSRQIC